MIREARALVACALVALVLACGGGDPSAPAGVPSHLELGALPDTAGVGDTLRPSVQVLDGRGHPVADAHVEYTSSAAFVVAVLPSGALRAVGEGEAMIRATAGDARDSVRVVVRRLARGLRLDLPADSIEFNAATSLVPVVLIADGLGRPMGSAPGPVFSSSDTTILRVDATTGTVTAVNAGSAQLVATAVGFTARRTIHVTLYEPFAGLGPIVQHSTGRWVTCARPESGLTYCQTAAGRSLAGTTTGNQIVPIAPVVYSAPFVSIGTGSNASCGLTAAGDAYCWGTGLTPISSSLVTSPVAMPKPSGVTSWSALGFNVYHSTDECLLDQVGRPWCWGSNQFGALGPSQLQWTSLHLIEGTPAFTKVTTSYVHGCGMTATRELWCWGDGTGYGRAEPQGMLPPTRIALPRAIRDFTTTFEGTCVVYVEGDVECWGYNQAGSIGRPPALTDYLLPAPVPIPGKVVSLSSAGIASCALTETGELWCWGALKGWDANGVTPFHFAPGYTFAEAKLGTTGLVGFLCARTTTGRVLCTTREDAR